MFLAVYLVLLGSASAVVGLWIRHATASLGLLPDFQSGLYLIAFVAGSYLAAQCAFMAVIKFLKPTRGTAPLLADLPAQAAVFLLLPSMAGLRIPIPYETLEPFEPMIHLGTFALVHSLFKLMTLYAAIQGASGTRFRALFWVAGTVAGLSGAIFSAGLIYQELMVPLHSTPTPASMYAVENTYAPARSVSEDMHIPLAMPPTAGQGFTLLYAVRKGARQVPARIHTALYAVPPGAPFPWPLHDRTSPIASQDLSLRIGKWTPWTLWPEDIPSSAENLSALWNIGGRTNWLRKLGIQQDAGAQTELLISGPWFHARNNPLTGQSIVLLLVEGLGAENMSLYGYSRETTPSLARHASGMLQFENAYTVSPDSTSAAMTLLTGVNPLIHRRTQSSDEPLPAGMRTLPELLRENGYFTAAITEGHGADGPDLVYGSGFERGFILFNDGVPMDTRALLRAGSAGGPARSVPAGARVTLREAEEFIVTNAAVKYFLFARLRELRAPRSLPRYGSTFTGRGQTPRPIDVYDNALAYLDRQIGLFLDQIAAMPDAQQPIVILTSPYGFDFTEPGRGAWRRGGEPKRNLHESSLRVPLLIRIPGAIGRMHSEPAVTTDLADTLAALGGVAFTHPTEGNNLLRPRETAALISMQGDPLALSIRTENLRFSWQSGISPTRFERIEDEYPIELTDLARYRSNVSHQEPIRRDSPLVTELTDRLRSFLAKHMPAAPDKRGTSRMEGPDSLPPDL